MHTNAKKNFRERRCSVHMYAYLPAILWVDLWTAKATPRRIWPELSGVSVCSASFLLVTLRFKVIKRAFRMRICANVFVLRENTLLCVALFLYLCTVTGLVGAAENAFCYIMVHFFSCLWARWKWNIRWSSEATLQQIFSAWHSFHCLP